MKSLPLALLMALWFVIDLLVAAVVLFSCGCVLFVVAEHVELPRQLFIIALSLCYAVPVFVAFWGIHLIWMRKSPGLRSRHV